MAKLLGLHKIVAGQVLKFKSPGLLADALHIEVGCIQVQYVSLHCWLVLTLLYALITFYSHVKQMMDEVPKMIIHWLNKFSNMGY